MAKFSQAFLQSMLQPSYQQGLFTAAQQLGAAPAQRRKLEQAQALKQQLAGIDTNTPEGLAGLAKVYRQQGDIPNAIKYEEAARKLTQQQKELTNIEGLRTNIINRANAVQGLGNLAETAETANPQQLESMRQTVLEAEQAKQLKAEQTAQAATAAEGMGFDANFIEVFSEDPEGLINVVRSVAEAKSITSLEKQNEKAANAVLVNRARSYNAPDELIQDIKDGLYTDKPLEALSAMRGEDSKNESYQDAETGEVLLLATKGAKVFKNNKWSLPSEIGLIEAPSVTAEGSVPKFKSEQRNIPFLAFAAGATDRLVNELDTFPKLQTTILTAGVNPFTTDTTEALDGYRSYVSESLLRFFSGAAVPEKEQQRYQKMFTITGTDILSAKATVQKIIAASALTSINAKLSSGEITPAEAREQGLEAGVMALSEEDYEILRKGKTGSLRKVIKKYTDNLLDSGSSTETNPVDSILNKWNLL